jgi:hypothetical protein
MSNTSLLPCLAVALLHWMAASPVLAAAGPYIQGRFQGRIAYSCDGNHNDPDDWAASPVTLAILAEAGLKERLVHFDYNCILPLTDPEWEKIHAESVLGAAERYGFDRGRFFDCRKDRDGAVASIAKAINNSTAADPLYFIIAGPMEVPYLGIQKSDPAKRQFVYCISHSRWNDGFASRYKFTFTKRSVIEQDVHWVQIRDQNRLLSFGRYGRPAPPEEFAPYFWLRDSGDAKVRWLWERMVVSTRPDPSDAGMTWFLATGDEECDPVKLWRLIDEHRCPAPVTARRLVRIEAENFRHLEGCALEDRNDKKASHALSTRLAGGNTGSIRTRFDEPFTRDGASYDVEIRYFDANDSRCRLALSINGAAQGAAWESPGEGRGWMSRTIREVAIRRGDEIRVDVQGDDAEAGKLDYVQLNLIPWYESLDAPGAFQVGHLRRLMESLPDLLQRVPDQSLLASEAGTGNEHIAVTRDARGRYALVYSAAGGPFTVKLDNLAVDKLRAVWFDPREGTHRLLSEIARRGTREFAPSTQGEGQDWILVLNDASRNFQLSSLTAAERAARGPLRVHPENPRYFTSKPGHRGEDV